MEALGPVSLIDHGVEHPSLVHVCTQTDDFMSYITKCYFYSVICPNVQLPANGVVTYSDPNIPRAVDSTVTYSCVFGYEFSGAVPRTCSVSGWTDGGSPTCTG